MKKVTPHKRSVNQYIKYFTLGSGKDQGRDKRGSEHCHPGLPDIINSDIRFWDGIEGHCTETSSDFKVFDFIPLTDALG